MSHSVIPAPVSTRDGEGTFELTATAAVVATGDAIPVAEYLSESLRAATVYEVPVIRWTSSANVGGPGSEVGSAGAANIELVLEGAHEPGGYALSVTPARVRITADAAAGLFAGVQTLRQLLPTAIEYNSPATAPWTIAATEIVDYPRFSYRGAMLDTSRHFYPVPEVKKYIDDLVLLKLNVLHLHLTDDQGWRIEIPGWPRLTEHGGSTAVDGKGGWYSLDDYREIVEYAASRFVTIVPEIDVPGHTNAALSAYPELTCDGVAPPLYEGTDVGFSTLCINKERVYEFMDDVIRELAAVTPGPWIHIGGDESYKTPKDEFPVFIRRVTELVVKYGKVPMGWHEIGRCTELAPGTVGQYWGFTTPENETGNHAMSIVNQGGPLVLSPANVAYLDMKYTDDTELGLVWAQGPTSVADSYSWEPLKVLPIAEEQILGLEAPIWSETLRSIQDVEYLAFPRLAAVAELAWSPGRQPDFFDRLGPFTERLDAAGINFYAPSADLPTSALPAPPI